MNCIADLHRILRVIEDEFVAGNILQLEVAWGTADKRIAGNRFRSHLNGRIERTRAGLRRVQFLVRVLFQILDGVRDIRSRRPLGVERKAFCDRRVEIVGSRIQATQWR